MRKPVVLITGAGGEIGHGLVTRLAGSGSPIITLDVSPLDQSLARLVAREFTGTSLNPQVPDLWAPTSMQQQLVPGQDWLHKPTDFYFQVLGRLDPGITLKHAQAEMDALVRQFAATYVTKDHTLSVVLQKTAFFGNTDDVRFQAGVGA